MEDNALKPNTSQPLPGDVPPSNQSAIGSFLNHFGVGKDGNKNAAPPQPESPPVPEQTTQDAPSDFASRLNGIDSKAPSMAGADVVREPNLTNSEGPTAQPPIPPQEEPQTQTSNLEGNTTEGYATSGEPAIGSLSPSAVAMPSSTTPDLTDSAVNSPAQDMLSQPVGTTANINSGEVINNISGPDITSKEPALPEEAREELESAKGILQEAVRQTFAAIDKVLGANLADVPQDTSPQEPVGTTV